MVTTLPGPRHKVDPQSRKIRATLQTMSITFDFDNTSLRQVLGFLEAAAGVNIILDPKIMAEDRTLTLKVNRMKLVQALDWVMQLTDLDYTIRKGAIFVSTTERLPRDRYVVIYPVADILFRPPDYPGPSMGPVGDEGVIFTPERSIPEDEMDIESLQSLVEMVMTQARTRRGGR
jgi:hypothetical protein